MKLTKNPILWFIGICGIIIVVLIAIVFYNPTIPFTGKKVTNIIKKDIEKQPESSPKPEADFSKSVESSTEVQFITSNEKYDVQYYPNTKTYTVRIFDQTAKKEIVKEVNSLLFSLDKDPSEVNLQWCNKGKQKPSEVTSNWECSQTP